MKLLNSHRLRLTIGFLFAVSLSSCSGDPVESSELRPSNYDLYIQAPFNQPSTYALTPPPYAYADAYQPIAEWTGRLILPRRSERGEQEFVWLEVHNAPEPYEDWVGHWVKLQWRDRPTVQAYVQAVTTDVRFTDRAWASQRSGSIHPTRLNQMDRVGPLESLAGARPSDNVVVLLRDPIVQQETDETGEGASVLAIEHDPVQITGRWQALVQVVAPVASEPNGDRLWVRHFNKETQQFDGPTEQIRIPQVPPDREGIVRSTPVGIQNSPFNSDGWYVYGDRDATGMFVVQAIEPRHLVRLIPDRVLLSQAEGDHYIRNQHWSNTAQRKGQGSSILVAPRAPSPEAAVLGWRMDRAPEGPSSFSAGDRALVLHIFGGIGGENAEDQTLWTTTGHLSYGIAQVIHDPLTDEMRFWIEHYQVYAHNPDGIISGAVHWSDYIGNLQRGWLGTRPVSDILIKLDAVTEPYTFGDVTISPMDEFTQQLRIMTARYRTGDGTGASIVTPAISCVQDSNQALYATIRAIERQVNQSAHIQAWLANHPHDPQTLRFQRLVRLGRLLEEQLIPLGIVRSDWEQNVNYLSGIESTAIESTAGATGRSTWLQNNQWLTILKSWRTVLPRRAHDEVSRIFLEEEASLWFIRTNQIGGYDPTIVPRAPTTLLGF